MDPLVSIILPVYKCENFIKATVESVLMQTYKNFELIIVDDCSPDNSFDICLSYSKLDSRISVFQNPVNSGAGVSRNNGLDNASGDLICFIDSDDIWSPVKLENQILFMIKNNAPICHTSYSLIDENDSQIAGGVLVTNYVDLFSYMCNTEIGMSTAMVDVAKTGPIRFRDIRTRQDTALWLELLERGFFSIGLNEILVNYRIRTGQISGNKFVMLFRTLKVFLTVKKFSKLKIFYCFLLYCLNATKKRF